MKNDSIIDFALSLSTGRIVDIRNAGRGKHCQCVCSKCGRPVMAKKGMIRRFHFSHIASEQSPAPCSGAPETALHKAAIQIVAGWKQISLPALEAVIVKCNSSGLQSELRGAIAGWVFWIESTRLPNRDDRSHDWIPDVILEGPKGELRVEIKVTHGISFTKQTKIDRDEIPTLEFDLSSCHATDGWNLSSLENRLLTDPTIVRWVYHPGYAALRERLECQLETEGVTGRPATSAPVSGHGALVFHPWFGLIPIDVNQRQVFTERNFKDSQQFDLRDGITLIVRRHALIPGSWLVNFYDSRSRRPRAGQYDTFLSDHLQALGYNSVYFGYPNTRILSRSPTITPILDFIALHGMPEHTEGIKND